jgi:hypothetical protein
MMKRPLSVTLFALLVLLLAAENVWRAILAIQRYDLMQSLGVGTAAIMLLIIGFDWAIGFAIAALGLWRRRPWGRRWMLIAIAAYQIHLWIERLTLERASYETLTRPADAIVSIALVIGVWGFLFLPGIRRAFSAQQPTRTTE